MAAPPLTVRVQPGGIRLDNGYQSVVGFSLAPNLAIFEKSIQPPAMDGGDPIPTSTMMNTIYETKAPQCLVDFDDAVIVAAYDPDVLSDLFNMLNTPQASSFAYPDGSYYTVWGYIRRVEPSPLVKGEQPELTLTWVTTNWDPVNCVEAGPVFVDGTGSCVC